MIIEIEFDNWNDAKELTTNMGLWGFRGHESRKWKLTPTIHRFKNRGPLSRPENIWHREYWMLKQFQRRAHNYTNQLPDFEQKIDWLALMQHYGAPTRLIDFSHSFYVSVFFAFENSYQDCCIWAVNTDVIRQTVANHFKVNTKKENIDLVNQRHIKIANEYINVSSNEPAKSLPLVINLEPDRLHERLLTQQGFFLFPLDIKMPFEKVLMNTLNHKSDTLEQLESVKYEDFIEEKKKISSYSLVKMIIPNKLHKEVMDDLKNMNITAATLFPGLDGFARSMKGYM